jgi:hypothetical protein
MEGVRFFAARPPRLFPAQSYRSKERTARQQQLEVVMLATPEAMQSQPRGQPFGDFCRVSGFFVLIASISTFAAKALSSRLGSVYQSVL